ncbi:MAG: dihydroorotate dehydrogenase [Candidatus Aminicenantes bacterium]|nr:dihydroorotate dehydrogenase [Candidatus Aminicenantes bacterium]
MIDLSVDLGFIRLKNPVIAASGTFGYGLEFAPFINLNEIGGFVVKGLYAQPRPGNPPPRLAETSSGLINAIGLPGIGMKKFTEEILPQLKKYKTALFVNVCGENPEEFTTVVDYLNGFDGITAYELNISCPNVKKEGSCPALCPEDTHSIVKLVKETSQRPVITKLSPNVTNIVEIALSAQEAGSDAISLVNTFLAMAIDTKTRKPKIANIMGGLSGPAIKPIALRMVYQVARNVTIPVLGMGGIMSGLDAVEFLLAGATAVEVGTANFINPEVTINIIEQLEQYCQIHGVDKLEDLIGAVDVPF